MARHDGRRDQRSDNDFGRVSGTRGVSGSRGVHVRRAVSEASRSVARGGIRFAVLDMLREKPRHGYDIIRAMEEASGGLYSPSPGAIYPTLQSLEDEDLVTSTDEEGKKVYAIAESGIAYLEENRQRAEAHRQRWDAQWGRGHHAASGEALREVHEFFHLVERVVRESADDEDRLSEIRRTLSESAAKIEDIAGR